MNKELLKGIGAFLGLVGASIGSGVALGLAMRSKALKGHIDREYQKLDV